MACHPLPETRAPANSPHREDNAALPARVSPSIRVRDSSAQKPSRFPCPKPLSSPLVLRVLALEFLLQFRICLPPERSKVFRHLHGTLVRREHLNPNRHPTLCNPEAFL